MIGVIGKFFPQSKSADEVSALSASVSLF